MFGLDLNLSILLIICILCACVFEFINGFHDTANAVATVIYTNSMKPVLAVVWSGFFNFLGVFLGGITVATGILKLLPPETLVDQSVAHNIAIVLALLLSAIIWNLLTWRMGIPCSSSHTLIGSILGVGIVYSLLAGDMSLSGVNWTKTRETGLSLLISPLMGFGFTMGLIAILKYKNKNRSLFSAPKPDEVPKTWIRGLLILTCTGVSFAHGSNDGQKGVGLIMLILISIAPVHFALNKDKNPFEIQQPTQIAINGLIQIENQIDDPMTRVQTGRIKSELVDINKILLKYKDQQAIPDQERVGLRKNILFVTNNYEKLKKEGSLLSVNKSTIKNIDQSISQIKPLTQYAPTWVVLMIAISLGIGTMVGWKRIVVTIGEKIGKEHLTYAQGASAELVAAGTIGLATLTGLPVSTTQVLSSGVAGSMVATNGIKNLQGGTIRNIAIAWLLTLPVTMLLSGGLFMLFRLLF
jgi:PiT family inorganic phosphate transporter